MEVAYYPNFDYEFELAGFPDSQFRRSIVARFEWLALLGINEGSVKLSRAYAGEYLDYLKGMKGLPEVVFEAIQTRNWWGELSNLPLEKKLNSKYFAASLARDILGFNFQNFSVGDNLPTGFMAKKEFSVSGRGIITKLIEKELKEIKFIEPIYQRSLDIGSRYQKSNGKWVLSERSLNEIDQNFNFRGATLKTDSQFEVNLESHDLDQQKILRALDQLLDEEVSEIQIDSFLYLDNGKLKAKAICEFNYRRSIVSVVYQLMRTLGLEHAHWMMRACAPLEVSKWSEVKEVCLSREALLLSPPEARDIAILYKNQSEIKNLVLDLANKFAIKL